MISGLARGPAVVKMGRECSRLPP